MAIPVRSAIDDSSLIAADQPSAGGTQLAITRSRWLPMPDELVTEALSLYHPEHRYLSKVDVSTMSIQCMTRAVAYPYTKDEQFFGYLTAPMASLLVAQSAYVLLGGLAQAGQLPPLDWTGFLAARDEQRLRFVRLEVSQRSELPNSSHQLRASLRDTRRRHGAYFARIAVAIGTALECHVVGHLREDK